MPKFLVTFLFIVLCSYFSINANELRSLTINIISRDLYNEAGKEVDAAILKEELTRLGHRVRFFDYRIDQVTTADINIFLAQFTSRVFSKAKKNWFIPNPDFCSASRNDLQKFDLVLCKTEECLRIFQPITKETYYLGFTSIDCHQPFIAKDFSKHLHVAGKSIMKATEEVLNVWKRNSDMPKLILIQRDSKQKNLPKNITLITQRVAHHSLVEMQNECGIHVCPSKTEGFGHYIMEAMAAGAVVITTDAPPMNEFIGDKRCLVKYKKTGKKNYATTYIVDSHELANTIKTLQQLPVEELHRIGQHNREEYIRRKAEFQQNFEQLMNKVSYNFAK